MSHPRPAMNTLSQGALRRLPGGTQEFSKLFCFLLRMPLYNPGWGETERASRANSWHIARGHCEHGVPSLLWLTAGQAPGSPWAPSLWGSWLDAILEQPVSSAMFSLQREDLCPGCFGIVREGSSMDERWLILGRGITVPAAREVWGGQPGDRAVQVHCAATRATPC